MHALFHHHEVRRAVRFGFVGVLNTVIDFVIFTAVLRFFHWSYLWANVLAFFVASLNSYILNRTWTFKSTAKDVHREALQYLVVIGIGFLINEGILFLFVDKANLAPILGKLFATGASLVWNFLANRFWTFRTSAQTPLAE